MNPGFYQIFFVLISAFENPRHKYFMNGELAADRCH
jgi:hypothetical protein